MSFFSSFSLPHSSSSFSSSSSFLLGIKQRGMKQGKSISLYRGNDFLLQHNGVQVMLRSRSPGDFEIHINSSCIPCTVQNTGEGDRLEGTLLFFFFSLTILNKKLYVFIVIYLFFYFFNVITSVWKKKEIQKQIRRLD